MTQLDVRNGVENRVIDVHHSSQLTINDVNPWHLESGCRAESAHLTNVEKVSTIAHHNRNENKTRNAKRNQCIISLY